MHWDDYADPAPIPAPEFAQVTPRVILAAVLVSIPMWVGIGAVVLFVTGHLHIT